MREDTTVTDLVRRADCHKPARVIQFFEFAYPVEQRLLHAIFGRPVDEVRDVDAFEEDYFDGFRLA